MTASEIVQARQQFEQQHLAFPYIPAELEGQVRSLGPWIWGTRDDAPGMYGLQWFVHEALHQPVDDYLLFGQAGHGISSYAMHYYLMQGPLAVFIQSEWGGAYTDSSEARNILITRFFELDQLVAAAREAQRKGRLALPDRVVVVVSDFIPFPPTTLLEGDGKAVLFYSPGALREALDYLETEVGA